jgi:hypothetical protein
MIESLTGRLSDDAKARLWRIAVTLIAPLIVLGSGVLLGKVLLTPEWARAVSVVGLGAVVFATLMHPAAGMLLWLVLAPFAGFLYLRLELGRGIPNLDVTRLTAMLLLVQIVGGVIGRPRRDPIRLTWVEAMMAAYALAMVLSLANSPIGWVGGVQTIFDFIVAPFLMYYFARNWLRDPRWIGPAVGAVALVSALLAAIAVREQLTGLAVFSPFSYSLVYEGRIRKVMSVFGSPAAMGMGLAVAVPFLLYGVRRASNWFGRGALGLALVTVLAGVFLTYVRAGWLGAVLGIILVLIASPSMRRAILPLAPFIAAAALVFLTLAAINPQTVQGRLTSEEPLTYRFDAWRLALQIFRTSPLLGVGYGNYGLVAVRQFGWNPYSSDALVYPSPHNSYLDVLTQGGLLAFLPFVAVFGFLLLRSFSLWRDAAASGRATVGEFGAILLATLVSYLAMIGTFDAINSQYANIVLFFIVGILVAQMEDGNRT